MGNKSVRCLLDSGAAFSVLHKQVFNSIKTKVELVKSNIQLQSATGSSLNVLGKACINFKINDLNLSQSFIIVDNLSQKCILGRDFLKANDCSLYFDLNAVRIKGEFISLQDDRFVASIVRAKQTTILKPNSTNELVGKLKDTPSISINCIYEICPVQKGFMYDEPNVELAPSLINLKGNRIVPVSITNKSNTTIRIKKGCIIGNLKSKQDFTVDSVFDKTEGLRVPNQTSSNDNESCDLSEIHSTEQQSGQIRKCAESEENVSQSNLDRPKQSADKIKRRLVESRQKLRGLQAHLLREAHKLKVTENETSRAEMSVAYNDSRGKIESELCRDKQKSSAGNMSVHAVNEKKDLEEGMIMSRE